MSNKQNEIKKEQLTEEIAIALKDYFKAQIENESNKINIAFDSENKFIVTVKRA